MYVYNKCLKSVSCSTRACVFEDAIKCKILQVCLETLIKLSDENQKFFCWTALLQQHNKTLSYKKIWPSKLNPVCSKLFMFDECWPENIYKWFKRPNCFIKLRNYSRNVRLSKQFYMHQKCDATLPCTVHCMSTYPKWIDSGGGGGGITFKIHLFGKK